MAIKAVQYEKLLELNPVTHRYRFLDRYTTKNGHKFYLVRGNSIAEEDFRMIRSLYFIALPKFYDTGLENAPELEFKFGTGEMYRTAWGLDGNLEEFLASYGELQFKIWLNQIQEIVNQTEEFILRGGDKRVEPQYSSQKLVLPRDLEDELRLEQICESAILDEYNQNRTAQPIELTVLQERAFVPTIIFSHVLANLREDGLLNEVEGRLTARGRAYLKDEPSGIGAANRFSQTVFMAQAFNPEIESVYSTIYEPLIRNDFKLNPIKINAEESTDPVDVAILNQIKQARFLICDLTFSRPSVYFEVGYALAIGVKVFFVAREDHNSDSPNFDSQKNKIHFDLRNRQITWWSSDKLSDLRQELNDRIKRHLAYENANV